MSLQQQHEHQNRLGEGIVDAESAIKAFRWDSSDQDRDLIVLQLSHTKQNLVEIFAPNLAEALSRNEDSSRFDPIAVLRLLTVLFSVRPEEAHVLSLESTVLRTLLQRSAKSPETVSQLSFFVADLINAAANHADSRRYILKQHAESTKSSKRIVEIGNDSSFSVLNWLFAHMEKANVENTINTSLLAKVALLAALAAHKLQKGQQKEIAMEGLNGIDTGKEKSPKGIQDRKDLDRYDDQLLFSLAKAFLSSNEELLQSNSSLIATAEVEMAKICKSACIEGLAYLTIEIPYRALLMEDLTFLQRLCRLGIQSAAKSESHEKTLFPLRGKTMKKTITSTYEADKAITKSAMTLIIKSDSALQYGLAMIFCNITVYPPTLSSEEKQLERLRKMASAKSSVKQTNATDEEATLEEGMSIEMIEARCSKLIEAGGVEAISSIALGGSRLKQTKGSLVLRETISKTFLSLTTKQDRMQRGRIVQQGGAKALIALVNQTLADLSQGGMLHAKSTFDAMQSLSHLLITGDPRVIFLDPAEAIPAILFMYLHSASSPLQRFEAALALTNIASVDERVGRVIVNCSFSRSMMNFRGINEFVGAGAEGHQDIKIGILQLLHERIFLEDNEMCRRSSLELLCNLLAIDERIFKQWSGENEDEENETLDGKKLKEGKTAKNLTFLLALCAPMGYDKVSQESGLKMRLAASGVVATLASSPSTCVRLFAAEDRLLHRLSELLWYIVEIDDQDVEKAKEAKLHQEDLSADPLGVYHATLQLALRSLTILDCLIQYISWLQSQSSRDVIIYKSKLGNVGYVEAMKKLASSLTTKVKEKYLNSSTGEVYEQVAQQAFITLRASKTLDAI